MTVNVGIIGTSWWADAMYLPALATHPHGKVTAICGRNRQAAQEIADRWQIPQVFTDYDEMIARGGIDAVIVSTPNDTHHNIVMTALDARKHILCEKPLALNYAQAKQMADLADERGVKNLVPFTYRHMPTNRYLKELVDGDYIGKPYHLNLRYNAGYGRSTNYVWRFDVSKAGAGAIGDIGSHFLSLAYWFFGDVTSVSASLGRHIPRATTTPSGEPYPIADDMAMVMLDFANGAQGFVQASTISHEPTPYGHTHHLELHGSEGTLYSFVDWDKVQRITGARADEPGGFQELPIPESIWGTARRDTVVNTYKDVFRTQDFMTREFVTAITEDQPLAPDFQEGAKIQRMIDAAMKSHDERRWVDLEEIQ